MKEKGKVLTPLLTAKQIAEAFQVPVKAVYEMAERGELPHYRIGLRRLRFDARTMNDYLATRMTSE